MRPFRSRVLAALVMAILSIGLLGNVAFGDDTPTPSAPVEPSPSLIGGTATQSFPEDPWGLPTTSFPEDPWPGI
ncbi:MAG: hypothetical protein E6J23_07075 [Chloroflexi bacterium]|jgi:hypothetical protein|nr:MAG: hypothetical protein E6J23_07075 [Chloroflexota bacterium]